MSMHAELSRTTLLTPTERERTKTPQQRAEDVIYTLNHTFTCLTLTDLFIVPILRGIGLNIGHGHAPAHSTGADQRNSSKLGCATDGCAEPAHQHGIFSKLVEKDAELTAAEAKPSMVTRIAAELKHAISHISWKGAGKWFAGEFIGDVGAAMVTIPLQRFAPGMMEGIQHGLEPVVGGFFKRGAERATHKWADRHGLEYDNQEVVQHAQELYHYEMRHLPQMAMWTVSSIALHYAAMKVMKDDITIGSFVRQKAAGAGITAAMVFGARAVAPDKAHQWDETAGKHVVVPLTKTVGKVFGIKERDVDDYHARHTNDAPPQSWTSRVKEPVSAALEASRT